MGIKIALIGGACIAVVLSLYAVFVIFNTWLLLPNDPALTASQNMMWRLGITAGSATALTGLVAFARWAFRKQSRSRTGGS
jgi:hypothetical protein